MSIVQRFFAVTRWLVLASGLMLASGVMAAESAAPVAPAAQLQPKAIEILKAASARLAAAKTLSFVAEVGYENPTTFNLPLLYTTRSTVTVQRPDKVRILTPGDGPATEFYYDGKTMTAFAPAEKLIATAAAPPTIEAALTAADESAAIYFPFTDLIVADPYNYVSRGLRIAFYIGKSTVVGGTTTDMIAYGNDLVFVQAWIGVEDKLPRRLRAVYVDDPRQLRHDLVLSDWKVDAPLPAGTFSASNAGGARKIPFARPDQGAPGTPTATTPKK